jgi:hypothetical protein
LRRQQNQPNIPPTAKKAKVEGSGIGVVENSIESRKKRPLLPRGWSVEKAVNLKSASCPAQALISAPYET